MDFNIEYLINLIKINNFELFVKEIEYPENKNILIEYGNDLLFYAKKYKARHVAEYLTQKGYSPFKQKHVETREARQSEGLSFNPKNTFTLYTKTKLSVIFKFAFFPVLCILAYSLFNQIIIYKYQIIPLSDLYSDLVIPFILSLTFLFLYKSYKIIVAYKNSDRQYFVLIFLFITLPSVGLQFDLHKYFISNKIINLSSINDLKDHKYDTYFSISNCSFQNISYIYPVNQTSGRYGQDIDLRLYISVPFENSKEIYLGVKYKRSINNIKSYSSAELKDEIKSFFNDSYHDFKNKNLKNVSSLKQLRMSDDKINYIKALKSGNVNINNPIILEEMNFKDIAITDGISTTTYLLGIWLLLYIIIWTIIVYSVGINKIKNIAEMKGSFSLSKLFSEYLIHIVPNKKFFMMPLIIDINVIVFLLMIFNGVNILYPNILDLNHWGGISKVNILKGEYWRLITYMFVHSGITHLAGNMFTLFLISIFIETYLGKVKYLLLYIITGVISVIISINANPNTIVVGASAGIMGLVGFYLSFFLFKKTRDKFNLSFGPLFIIMILSTIAIGFLGNSDTVAHVTGLASGFIAGLVYDGFFVKKEADPNPQKFD